MFKRPDDKIKILSGGLCQLSACKHIIKNVHLSQFCFPAKSCSSDVRPLSDYEKVDISLYPAIGLEVEDNSREQKILLLTCGVHRFRNLVETGAIGKDDKLNGLKTIVFRVPSHMYRKYQKKFTWDADYDEVLAAASIVVQSSLWLPVEVAVLYAFEEILKPKLDESADIWKNYKIDDLNEPWKKLFFLCCAPIDVRNAVRRLALLNWQRMASLEEYHMKQSDFIKESLFSSNIFDEIIYLSRKMEETDLVVELYKLNTLNNEPSFIFRSLKALEEEVKKSFSKLTVSGTHGSLNKTSSRDRHSRSRSRHAGSHGRRTRSHKGEPEDSPISPV